MLIDLTYILSWWLILFGISLTTLPLTAGIFPRFADRGYPFAKILGIIIISYTVFVLGTFRILPFTFLTVVFALIITSVISFLANPDFRSRISGRGFPVAELPWKLIFLEEFFFVLLLIFWSFVRGYAPEIHGLEKFMDFGFVNSSLNTPHAPVNDMWLAKAPDFPSHSINYYYFGHFTTAVLTRLSGMDPAVTYNLMMATLAGLTFVGSFSIGINLFQLARMTKKTLFCGFLAGFLVAFAGNLHTIYLLTSGYPNDKPLPFWQIFKPLNILTGGHNYWYPNATRFIPFTIHEFPIYSFVVSDLHGHVLDIPVVLLFLVLILNTLIKVNQKPLESQNSNFKTQIHKSKLKAVSVFRFLPLSFSFAFCVLRFAILPGFILAVMYMTNVSDFLVYLALTIMALFYLLVLKSGGHSAIQPFNRKLLNCGLHFGAVVIFFLIFSLPFSLHFKPFASGIAVNCPPKILENFRFGPLIFETIDKCQHTPVWQWLILWGFFVFNIAAFIILVILPRLKNPKHEARNNLHSSDVFILIVSLLSVLLLVFPEFFYFKDIYPAHFRANTMFKLGYQAFIMMMISSAYIIFRILNLNHEIRNTKYETNSNYQNSNNQNILSHLKIRILNIASNFDIRISKFIYLIFLSPQLFLISIYPYFAINSYYGNLKNYKGLYGLNWLAESYPDDYQAVIWLRSRYQQTANRKPPTILEAVGDSYTDHARISANTGLPAVLGWPVHEWLWRGSYDEAGKRIALVSEMYTSGETGRVKELLDKYAVAYVIVGGMERQKHPNINEENFRILGKLAFETGNTRIYQLSR